MDDDKKKFAGALVQLLKDNPERLNMVKDDPVGEIEKLAAEVAAGWQPPFAKEVYKLAVVFLGVLTLAAALGSILITLVDNGRGNMVTPEVLVALGSAAIGALVGLFAPTPSSAG